MKRGAAFLPNQYFPHFLLSPDLALTYHGAAGSIPRSIPPSRVAKDGSFHATSIQPKELQNFTSLRDVSLAVPEPTWGIDHLDEYCPGLFG